MADIIVNTPLDKKGKPDYFKTINFNMNIHNEVIGLGITQSHRVYKIKGNTLTECTADETQKVLMDEDLMNEDLIEKDFNEQWEDFKKTEIPENETA